MTDLIWKASKSEIRLALTRLAYFEKKVRVADPDLSGWDWLVATHRGVFAVSRDRFKLVLRGWFFGLCWHADRLYAFENCGHREQGSNQGRVIRLDIADGQLGAPHVLIIGLHNNCHQIAIIDDVLCVVDTANQGIRRYTLEGDLIDLQRPFPYAPLTDQTGAYLHINSIAKIGNRIGLILHNGKALPLKNSEVAWLDANWSVIGREYLPGHSCHDIIQDEEGRLWHSLSRAGQIWRSDGARIHITDDKMTRGIAIGRETIAVGISTFGPRHVRGTLTGAVVLLDRYSLSRLQEIDLPAAPADIITI